jgi:hypothetical protein
MLTRWTGAVVRTVGPGRDVIDGAGPHAAPGPQAEVGHYNRRSISMTAAASSGIMIS